MTEDRGTCSHSAGAAFRMCRRDADGYAVDKHHKHRTDFHNYLSSACSAGSRHARTGHSGPCQQVTLYVCFTVPEPLCNQVMQFDASSKTLQSCSHKLNPSALTVKFPAHEAYERALPTRRQHPAPVPLPSLRLCPCPPYAALRPMVTATHRPDRVKHVIDGVDLDLHGVLVSIHQHHWHLSIVKGQDGGTVHVRQACNASAIAVHIRHIKLVVACLWPIIQGMEAKLAQA